MVASVHDLRRPFDGVGWPHFDIARDSTGAEFSPNLTAILQYFVSGTRPSARDIEIEKLAYEHRTFTST